MTCVHEANVFCCCRMRARADVFAGKIFGLQRSDSAAAYPAHIARASASNAGPELLASLCLDLNPSLPYA